MNKVSIVGIDLAKSVFQLYGSDKQGKCVLSKRVKRKQLLPALTNIPNCIVAMEACGGSYHWARKIQSMGHEVRLIPAQYVKPYVRLHKNDYRDAEGIVDAASRPNMPTVAIKSVEQQDMQAIHRIRERLIKERTAIGNQLRGLLGEYGVILAKGHAAIRQGLQEILEDASNDLSAVMREISCDLRQQWYQCNKRIGEYDQRMTQLASQDDRCRLLQTIPGIGLINASLLLCHAGDARHYRNGRQFSASLGLVPRQHSSGNRSLLMGINKQGDVHVRRQLVHGARSALRALSRRDDRLSRWAAGVEARRGKNKAIIALANKMARIAWAVLATGKTYEAYA
jgi:transposase